MASIPPPAVADPHANASLDDAYQGGHVNAEIRAARASKRRKTAETLHGNNRVTEQELGQQEVFHQQQVTSALPAGAAIPGAPAWFGPAMAAVLATMNARLDNVVARQENMSGRLDNMSGQLDKMSGQLDNVLARQENALALQQTDDALQPICDAAGNIAPSFPATYGALNALTDAERSQLLVFYGRPANPVSTREQRLKQLFGIRPCIEPEKSASKVPRISPKMKKHDLKTLPNFKTFRGTELVDVATTYAQRKCSCGAKKVRTYCQCSPGVYYCNECYATHVLES